MKVNSDAVLALIGELYAQAAEATEENAALRAMLAQLQTGETDTPPGPSSPR